MESPPDKPTRCAACRGTLTGDARACPHCGIRILYDDGTRDGTPSPPAGFDNLPPGLAVPRSIRDAIVAPEGPESVQGPPEAKPEPEETNPDVLFPAPSRLKHVLIVLAVLAVCAAVIHIPRWISSGVTVETDPLEILEDLFRSYLDSDALKPPDANPPIDLDVLTAEMRNRHPKLFDRIRSTHQPFTRKPGQSLHDFFETYLERLYVLDPTWAQDLGLLPHPTTITPVGPETDIRWFLVDRDTWRVLESWPDRDRLSAHDRIDLALFRSDVEMWLRQRPDFLDQSYLAEMLAWFDTLEYLSTFDCCANDEHLKRMAACLEQIAGRLDEVPDLLKRPPLKSLDYTTDRLVRIAAYLKGLSQQGNPALTTAALKTLQSIHSFLTRLRKEVIPRAGGAYGIGPENYDCLLRTRNHLPESAREILRYAIDEFSAARKVFRKAQQNMPDALEGRTFKTAPALEDRVKRLSGHVDRWISPPPRNDPGVRIRQAPLLWHADEEGDMFYYVDPGPLARPAPAFVLYKQPDTSNSDYQGRESLFHTAAHESYPGHHLQALIAREEACRLRRTFESAFTVEGWAVYAEDLIHETGECSCEPYLRAGERLGRAFSAILEILIQTRAATFDDILDVLRYYSDDQTITDTALADITSSPPLSVSYLIGHREIRRIRRNEEKRLGPEFRLREFHGRLLRCGPLPPALLEEALRE